MPELHELKREARGLTGFCTRMDDIPEVPLTWLWNGRLPRAKLTILAGEPGIGKSLLAADLAARVTCGAAWPDGEAGVSGEVLLLCAEDDAGDTVRPRISAAGGDVRRIYVLQPAADVDGSPIPLTLPRNCRELENVLDSCTTPKLIVIDPLAAYLGPGGDFGSEIQARLSPLIDLASRWNVAILGISHRDLRTPGGSSRRAGSVLTLLAASRAAWQLVADRGTDRRVMLPVKNNFGPTAGPLAFTIHGERIQWDSDGAPPVAPKLSLREFAGEWLRKRLANGPVAAKEVLGEAHGALFTATTLRHAASDLGVTQRSEGFQGSWFWELPSSGAKPYESLQRIQNIGEFERQKGSEPPNFRIGNLPTENLEETGGSG